MGFALRQFAFKFRSEFVLPFLLVFLAFGSYIPLATAATLTVRAEPPRLVNGAPVLFQVKSSTRFESLAGSWLGHPIVFSFDSATKTWFALAGVSLETAPGLYALELTGERAQKTKEPFTFARKFSVTQAKYPKIELTVSTQFTEPDPNQGRSKDKKRLSEPRDGRARVVGKFYRSG
jgi:hypothetical protein